MAGEVDRLVADAFHEAAVAGDDVSVVVYYFVAIARIQHAFGKRHADGRRDTLTERSRRRLDAKRVAVFGMSGRAAAELAKRLQLREIHIGIAEQMMQAIEQHRAVARR
jgi:hypothetical protein